MESMFVTAHLGEIDLVSVYENVLNLFKLALIFPIRKVEGSKPFVIICIKLLQRNFFLA